MKERVKTTAVTHQTFYKDYQEAVGKDALDFRTFDRVVRGFFKKLSRSIIVDKYEWKVPYGAGYIRIAKTKSGKFFWKWDTMNPYTRLKKKRMWTFKPVVDWKYKQVGLRGLAYHYFGCLENNKVPNYDVPNIRHFVPKGRLPEIIIE